MISIASQSYQGSLSSNKPTTTTAETSRFSNQFPELSQPAIQAAAASINAAPAPVAVATQATQLDSKTSTVSAAIKNFIAWQGAQPNPLGQGTIADVWAKQGITDPLSNPVLIGQAEAQLNRAEQRSAMNPNYVAEWNGDWKTQMAESKASENQRQTFLAAADALGKVTVGGGMVS
jgi:hypothetical protein